MEESLGAPKEKKGKKKQKEDAAATKIQSKVRQNEAKKRTAEKRAERQETGKTEQQDNGPLSTNVLYDVLATVTQKDSRRP